LSTIYKLSGWILSFLRKIVQNKRPPVQKDKQQLQESKPRRVSPPAGGEIKQKYAKIQDMRLDFCSLIGQVCAFGVRTARCKFPIDPRPAWIESVSKRLF